MTYLINMSHALLGRLDMPNISQPLMIGRQEECISYLSEKRWVQVCRPVSWKRDIHNPLSLT